MKKIFTSKQTKSAFVITLALLQVSFFMKQDSAKAINRYLAQEIDTSGIDTSLDAPAASTTMSIRQTDVEVIEVDDPAAEEIDYSSLIPEKLPENTTVQAALDSFTLKSSQCLVKDENDLKDVTRLDEDLKSKIETYKSDRTNENYQASRLAYYELANKLVSLGMLQDIETDEDDSAEDISQFDVRLNSDDKTDADDESSSVFLSEDNTDDLKEIGECHLAKLEDLDTEAEKRTYFEKHNVAKYVDAIRTSLDESPEELQRLANEYYSQANQADQLTDQLNGFRFSAQTHGASAIAIYKKMAEIEALKQRLAVNPNDQTLSTSLTTAKQNLQDVIKSELLNINILNKSAVTADPNISSNSDLLSRAHKDIDDATLYWATQAEKLISGQQATLFSDFAPTTTISAGNPLTGNGLNLFGDNSVLTGGTSQFNTTNNLLTDFNDPFAQTGLNNFGGAQAGIANFGGAQTLRGTAGSIQSRFNNNPNSIGNTRTPRPGQGASFR